MEIKQKLTSEHKTAVSALFISALGEKFLPILGQKSKAVALLNASYNRKNCFLALEQNKLLGFLAFQTKRKSFLAISLKNMCKIFGFLPGIAKALALSLLNYRCKSGEFYIDAIAVAEAARGKGAGTKLINASLGYAKTQGFKFASLQVINTNPKAKALYEKLGFRVVKKSTTFPFNAIFKWNFQSAYLMRKEL